MEVRFFTLLLCLMVSLLTASALAEEAGSYRLLGNMGSTGTRLYLYNVQAPVPPKRLPTIHRVGEYLSPYRVASFKGEPSAAGKAFAPLLQAMKTLAKQAGVAPAKIRVRLLATGGMRGIKDKTIRENIFAAVARRVREHSHFDLRKVRMIHGKEEAWFAWLAGNYRRDVKVPFRDTQGLLDVGGASVQFSYRPANSAQGPLFVHSFMGLGLESAKRVLNAPACYPTNYPLGNGRRGKFDFQQCTAASRRLFRQHSLAQQEDLPDPQPQVLQLISAAHYTLHFFKLDEQPQPVSALQAAVKKDCGVGWQQLQSSHPEQPVKYLSQYCFAGTYISAMLDYYFPKRSRPLLLAGDVAHQGVDWTLGAVLAAVVARDKPYSAIIP